MEILIIICLILINGFFSMSEMSLVSSRKFKLEQAKKKGKSGARIALELSENPTKFLSTVQIGITLIGVLLGVYSGDKLTTDVTDFIKSIDSLKHYADNIAVVVIVVFITYLSIVLGELFPKRLGMTFPEPIAMMFSKPMNILSKVTSPFVWLLTFSNDLLVKLFGIKKTTDSKVSEEELKSIIKESAEGGEIQDIEQNIVERVFELGDRKVNTLFTHRSDLVYFDVSDDWKAIKTKISNEKHSAYPVCDNNIDTILGIVLLKDLFTPDIEINFNIKKFIKQPVYLNENTFAYKALEQFKIQKIHYGIIVDEYGVTQGMVTMDDVIDALFGDVTEQGQEEYEIVERNENSWLVDGQYSAIEFFKYLDLSLGENTNDNYTTVAGLIIYLHNSLPNVGDKVKLQNYELEIIDKDGQRIDKVLVTKTEN